MQYGKQTDVGRVRQLNEDACAIAGKNSPCQYAVIADGMGGHNAGDIASDLAVNTIVSHFEKGACGPNEIRLAIEEANKNVFDHANDDQACSGMGTTLVAAVFQNDIVYVANVGDSRAYYFDCSQRVLSRITTDHSLMEEMINNGELRTDQINAFPFKNVITRSVGTSERIRVDLFDIEWKEQDMVLLCSDGLTRHLSDEILRKKMLQNKPLQLLCDELVSMARQAGGLDNVTVIVVRNCAGGDQG